MAERGRRGDEEGGRRDILWMRWVTRRRRRRRRRGRSGRGGRRGC